MSDNIIKEFLVLNVPTDYPTIQDALDWLEDKKIAVNAGVDIHVADGEYIINKPIQSKVSDSTRLTIRGNEQDCSKCVIKVENNHNVDGFLFEDGNGVGWLDGFTIIGIQGWLGQGEWHTESYGAGIRVIGHTHVVLGTKIVIEKMYYGIRAMYGASVVGNHIPSLNEYGGGICVKYAGDVAFHAYAANMQINGAEAYNTSHISEGLGFGFCAEAGGFIICEYSKAVSNEKAGFYALSNGTAWAHAVVANQNRYGALAWGGTVECNSLGKHQTNLYQNQEANICSKYKGFIGANSALANESKVGVLAEFEGVVDFTAGIANSNSLAGVLAQHGGKINGFSMTANKNAKGFHATHYSYIYTADAQANDNTEIGYLAENASTIICPNFGGVQNKVLCSPLQTSAYDKSGNRGSWMIDT